MELVKVKEEPCLPFLPGLGISGCETEQQQQRRRRKLQERQLRGYDF